MQAVKRTEAGIEVVDIDDPAGDGAMVEVRASSLCGSDLHMIGYGPIPCVLGHEFAGVLDDGTPVAVDPSNPCGECPECRTGRRHLCNNGLILGITADGGMAERVRVRPDALIRLPAGLPVEHACLVEPLAVAVHGLEQGGIAGGERVAVVGAGSIGLAAVASAAAAGCAVDLEARHDTQRVAGERLGALGPTSGGYDVVFEAAGTQSALDRAVELVRPGGLVVFLSTFWEGVTMPGVAAMMKEATFKWAFTYAHHGGGRDVDTAAALLARRPEIATTLITHRFPLADAPEAFRVAADRAHGAIKVVLEPA
ncbi:MAG: alcohol dehydrogenase catalytic domain-containing protein [Acidimicrobiia bacterium]|jgi:threonine dehydrogenase-like Zn-dependent dehydrogenase